MKKAELTLQLSTISSALDIEDIRRNVAEAGFAIEEQSVIMDELGRLGEAMKIIRDVLEGVSSASYLSYSLL